MGEGVTSTNLPFILILSLSKDEEGRYNPCRDTCFDRLSMRTGKRIIFRVIGRRETPKQPRGSSIQVRIRPLGCFAALAMTRI